MNRLLVAMLSFFCLTLSFAPVQAIVLRYDLKKGIEFVYSSQEAAAYRSDIGIDKSSETSQDETRYRIKVADVTSQGDLLIEQEMIFNKQTVKNDDGTTVVTATLNGSNLDITMTIPKGKEIKESVPRPAPVKYRLSPLGKLTFVSKPAAFAPTLIKKIATDLSEEDSMGDALPGCIRSLDAGEPDNIMMEIMIDCIFLPLPEKDVKVSDSWEEKFPMKATPFTGLPGQPTEPLVLNIKSTVTEINETEGKATVKLRTEFELPFTTAAGGENEVQIKFTNKLVGTMDWTLDNDKHCLANAQGSQQFISKGHAEIPPELMDRLPEGMGTEASFVAKANTKIALVQK
jgi:hypothetical protein